MKSLLIIFVLAISSVTYAKKSYEGYKVYKVVPKTKDQVTILLDIQKNGDGQFWIEHFDVNHDVRVMVSKEKQNTFLMQVQAAKLEVVEIIDDLQRTIDAQLSPAATKNSNEEFFSMTWDQYYDLSSINNWLDQLQEIYPNIVKTVVMGKSNEDRDIKGIIINYKPNQTNKLIGMIEGTLHAREWITTATVTWIIKEFLTSTDPEVRSLAENLEWHIFPVVNPDGYSYTFTDDRMWRKNRNFNYSTNCSANVDNDMSNGVDLNRNFDFVWNTVGVSPDPCSNTFPGSSAFSEPESQAISQYVLNLHNEGELIYYLAFHSYSQLVCIPYSHVTGMDVLQVSNYADLYEIGVRGAEKLRQRFGTEYTVGVSANIMYPMSGTSFDWVKNSTDVPVTYLLELRDLGEYGFLLPPEQIIPSNLEVMDFILEMDRNTKLLGYYSGTTSILCSALTIVFCLIFVFLNK